jgi:hypothetical protein
MRKGIYKGLLFCFFIISSPANGKEPRIVIAYPASETSQALTYTHVIDGIEKAVGHAERLEVTEGSDASRARA